MIATRSVFATACLAAILAGCAPSTVSLDRLLADAADNEIKTLEEHRGDRLRLTGTVERRGLRPVERGDVQISSWGMSATVRKVRVDYAFILLQPEDPSLGRLLCYFTPSDRAQVGEVSVGQRVTLDGRFGAVRRKPAGMLLRFDSCDVVD